MAEVVRWSIATRRVLAALSVPPREAPGAETPLERALSIVCEVSKADVALLLCQLDPVTARVVGSVPPAVLPDGLTTPAVFAGALDSGRSVYRIFDETSSAIPAPLRGSAAVVPWPRPRSRASGVDRTTGALLLIRRGVAPFSPPHQAFLEDLVGLFQVLVELEGEKQQVDESRVRLDAIVHALPHGLVFVDGEGAEAWVNGTAATLLELPQGAVAPPLVAQAMAALRARADDPDELTRRGQELLSTPGAEIRDWRWVFSQTERRALSVSSTPTGTPRRQGRLWLFMDVTEQHFAQQDMKEKNLALEAARRQADAANTAKSLFLASMTHEIRTPMNAVIGFAGLLADTELTPEQRDFTQAIRTSGEHLLGIINDVLDFSKLQSGHFELTRAPFDLRRMVESALDFVAGKASEKGLELIYAIDPGVPAGLEADEARVRQILINYLSNAVKFTDQGEVVVRVQSRPLEVGGHYEFHFSVEDTGIGITADRIGWLFREFSQVVDGLIATRYGGTGLGLAICKRLTELHGGRVWVDSTPRVGSVFHFTIPALARADVEAPPSRAIFRGLNVLVIDDNATSAEILRAQAESWGMFVRATKDPEQALGWVESQDPFDLILVDHHMPGMDGIALARRIRAVSSAAEIPLLLLSSVGSRNRLAGEAGVDFTSVLTKPIRQSDLLDRMAEALRRGSLQEQRGSFASRVDLEPLSILLAEDNRMNQRVALLILEQLGYRADLAADGIEAIQALERTPYDVVLMDVQMPNMDGLAATRAIRARGSSIHQPRIIAMTANALRGDREVCLAAGMDDYLSKPIVREQLMDALRVPAPSVRGKARPLVDVEGEQSPEVDGSVLDDLAAALGSKAVISLIDAFTEDTPQCMAQLRYGLNGGDPKEVAAAAHQLKSNCRTLGAERLSRLFEEMETTGRKGTLAGVARSMPGAEQGLARALNELAAMREELYALEHR
ncbi:MAG TPA: response regulator [Polyangia bacterium]|nr:response regulator [Polyangia bacterium]